MTDTTPKEEGPRNFARFLESLADGEAVAELSAKLFELGKALREESNARRAAVAGTLALTIKLGAADGIVNIAYEVKTTPPKPQHRKSIMWLTEGGNLSPSNPRQPELPHVREVASQAETRDPEATPRVKEV